MKRTLIPLVLIIAIVLGVSVAMASDYSTTGPISETNGWSTSGNWNGNSPIANTGDAYATHPVTTGPSGAFSLVVRFTIGDAANEMSAGVIGVNGARVQLGYANHNVVLNGNYIGGFNPAPSTAYDARVWSEDGSVWHVEMGGITQDVSVGDVPSRISVGLFARAQTSPFPVITSVNFLSSDAPVATPTPVPTPTPTPSNYIPDPELDPKEVQYFYDNIYPLIGSPYDTVTYNPDGSYVMTPGNPASSTHSVAGTVISAADGSPIAGASVLLGDSLQKTDSAGKYSFPGIAGGVADIAVSADGFAAKTQTINVNADVLQNFALDKVAAGGSTVASAENETTTAPMDTNVTMPANATVEPTMAPTTIPSPTQTQSPGFEGIVAAIAIIGAAGVLVCLNRKR